LSKIYGIKARCYWESLGEHIENLMGIHWELEGNKGKMKKNPSLAPQKT
jgi:hypothetical protein